MRLAYRSRRATAGALFAVLGSLSAPLIASAQPAAQKLTIALASNINTLDPDKTNTVGTDLSVIAHIYTPLVDRGSDMKLRPGLAISWTAVNDTTWRFVLKPGVTFPDGEKLDAAAVKWNVDRILDPKTGARNRPWFDNIADVKVVSPTELEFITKSPYPDLPAQMTMFFLMAPKWTAQNNPAVQAMGTGPYTLQSYAPGDRVVLRARDGEPGPQPQFQQVTFRMIRDDAARVAALRAGEVDFISVFPTGEVKRLSSIPHIKAGSVAGTRVMFVKLNAIKAPFKDNPTLWQALNYAVDKQGINAALLDGQGQIANCQPLSPAFLATTPNSSPFRMIQRRPRRCWHRPVSRRDCAWIWRCPRAAISRRPTSRRSLRRNWARWA